MAVRVVVALLLVIAGAVGALDWKSVDDVLLREIHNHTFPGCVAIVGGKNGTWYTSALGDFTYGLPAPASGTNPAMALDTIFDLASLTKVIGTTTATMLLYQRGLLQLDMLVSDVVLLGSAFAAHGKGPITVRNLLLHNSGFPPDPSPGYWQKAFGCPASAAPQPAEVFTCQQRVYQGLMEQTLLNSIGAKYVYSDLNFITLTYIVGKLARTHNLIATGDLLPACYMSGTPGPWRDQCYYEAFVRKFVLQATKMRTSMFLPPPSLWPRIAPTWNDTRAGAPGGEPYRYRVMQGQVSDQNAYAMGGIAGHAGLFSTAPDLFHLLQMLLFAPQDDSFVNQTTVKLFTTIYNETQSSRALGWDTNNYNNSDYLGCGNLSSNSWTHTGYTGTEVCVDPERQLITVLLTNRVYPNASEESLVSIHWARQRFNNAVRAVVDGSMTRQAAELL